MEWLLLLLSLLILGVLVFYFLGRRSSPPDSSHLLLQREVEALREQVRLSLEGSSHSVNQRLDSAARVVRELSDRMGRVEETTKQVLEVGKDISSLQQILKAPKLRGNLSEQLLGDLLSQMLPRENYDLQYTFRNGERVDAVIHTSQGMVPVDAKFPLENFQKLVTAATDEEKKQWRKEFMSDVKKHIDDIAAKYILPAEGTFEFAMMYIPAENVYYEATMLDGTLNEYAWKKRVMPVSPNSFYAYLNTILLGLRGLQVEKSARIILNELGRLQDQMGKFRDKFTLVGRHLSHASKAYDDSDKSLTRFEDQLSSLNQISAPAPEESAAPLELTDPQDGGPRTPIHGE